VLYGNVAGFVLLHTGCEEAA